MILPDAGYLWQHLLWLGSSLLSWLHVWHVWNDATRATALKSSCPSVMLNPCPSSQPYKSAGFNQSGAHLMQSLSSHRAVASDKWSKHSVTGHSRGSPAPLDLQWVSLQHSSLLLLILFQNLEQLSWPLLFHSRSAPVQGDLGSMQGYCSTWGSRMESTSCFSVPVLLHKVLSKENITKFVLLLTQHYRGCSCWFSKDAAICELRSMWTPAGREQLKS